MKKFMRILWLCLAMLFVPLCMSACWDSIDINDRSIITSIIFDYKDNEVILLVERAVIISGTGSGQSTSDDQFEFFVSKGKSLQEVRDKLDAELAKPIDLSTARSLLLTESFANEYMMEYLYRFRSIESYRKKINTYITTEDPEQLFNAAKEKQQSIGFLAEGITESLESTNKHFSRTTMRLLENLSNEYTGMLLPKIGVVEKTLSVIGFCVLKGEKIIGTIPITEANGVLFMKAYAPKLEYAVDYKGKVLTVEVTLGKSSMCPSIINNKPHFDVNACFEAMLLYPNQKLSEFDFKPQDEELLALQLKQMLTAEIEQAILVAQQTYNCDYLQFDDLFRIKFPKQFNNMDWDTVFPTVTSTVKANVSVKTKWTQNYEKPKSQ